MTNKPVSFALAASVAASVAVLGAAPVLADEQGDQDSAEMTKGEEQLARMLEGRVAGEPTDCIRSFPNQPVRTIEETAYVYGRGNTIYVQRTRRPEDIDRDDIVVVRRFEGTRLCRMDFVTTIDRFNGFFTGGIQFAEFVPYTRVDEDDG